MDQDENKVPEKKKENFQDKAEQWIDKAEKFIDEASDKIHKSDAYKKADKSIEKATIKLFRRAGRWWGKSEQKFNDQEKKKDTK